MKMSCLRDSSSSASRLPAMTSMSAKNPGAWGIALNSSRCSAGSSAPSPFLADHLRRQVRACPLVVVAQMLAEGVGDDFVHIDRYAQSSRSRIQLSLAGGLAFSTMDTSTSTAAKRIRPHHRRRVHPNPVDQPKQHSRQIKKQHGIRQAFAALLSQLHDLRDKRHRSCKKPPRCLYRPLPTYSLPRSPYSR